MHSEGNGPTTLGRIAVASILLVLLSACGKDSGEVIGHAYVAPEKLNLRHDLTQKNSTVAVLKHGDQIDIVDVRRRFVRVRTHKGQEGWVDSLQLLSQEQMDQIRQDDERYLALPSEGKAGVYEALNIHIEPNRQSPAFTRIPEGGSVVVLAYKLEPKSTGPLRPPNFERPVPERHSRRDRSKNANLPPPPPPPKPPANWQELSRERVDGAESVAERKVHRDELAAQKKTAVSKKPVVMEEWALVRTKDNQVGWVLARNLVMSIPDEVAQYAEGKRITSYFELRSVEDEEKGLKHDWLWTTLAEQEPCDFDSWRVFIWNRRRHRYETSYRQRDIEGYFPVHVDAADPNAFDRTFELITKDDDGKMRRRKYAFDGTRVHLVGTEDYRPGESSESARAGGIDTAKLEGKKPHDSWFKREWNAIRRRLTGT
jgi:SH3-like domain-containing protein